VLALAHADAAGAGPAERSAWLEQLGRLRSGLHDLTGAMQAWREALVLHQAAGHSATGHARCRANLAVLLSPRPDAVNEARQACALMEPQPPGSAETALARYALAVALTNQGQVEQALPHARAAVSAAESAGHAAALTQALSVCVSVELSLAPSAAAFAMLERSIALASEARLTDHAGARSRAQAVALLQRAADSPPVR
jgi:hypothetical protein